MEEILIVLKIRKEEYNITEKDKFLDNGKCIQIMTKKGPFRGWNYTTPLLTKKMEKEISKLNKVYHEHKHGTMCKVFSLTKKESNGT